MFFRILFTCTILLSGLVQASNQPNIVLITADDMGFDDISLHGHPHIKTPNLDALAQKSVQFSDFTVTPVCSTTRASLLTGRDFYKTGVSGVHGGRDFMHLSETLISEVLQKSGYKTGTWGKWHLGKTEGYYPWNRGFDEGYYAELYRHENSNGYINGQPVQHEKWVSDVITDYAIEFINDNKTHPFFAYLSYLAPHEPWLAPDEFVQPLIKKGLRPAIANLYGMVNEMDFHIGRLMSHLNQQNLLDNTIVIFLSDNGPWWDSSNFGAMTKQEWQARNPSKMNGNKGQSWQNGIRSPLFVHWPEKWAPAKVERYVDVKDLFPTLVEISGATLNANHKKIDGLSLLNYLRGDVAGKNPRETYIGSHDVISNKQNFNQWTPFDDVARSQMHYKQQLIGLRTEQYKLLLNPSSDQPSYPVATNGYVLFDMQQDPKEQVNLFEQRPDIAKLMADKLETRFNALKLSQEAYRPPVYTVGKHDVSIVNGFGPSKTSGNILSKAHQLSQIKHAGDSAEYKLNVTRADDYLVFIKQQNTDSVGLKIKLSNTNQEIIYEFDEQPVQRIGKIQLPKGEVTVKLELLENNSIKHWSAISGLRRIFFVKSDSNIHPESWPVPN